jgi:uncharacterized protein (TIGR03067 family)
MEKDEKIKMAEFTLKLDPSKTPRALDLAWDFLHLPSADKKAAEELKKLNGKTIPAIYSLEGDALRIFANPDAKERPKVFPKKDGEGIIILKREKP